MENSIDDPSGPPPVIPALQRHLQLETDLFCHGCGYNLHGQIVTHDERLGFLICRCPECGRFHPAAMGVSATRPWLARLGVLLVSVWMLAALFVFGFGGFFVGVCMYGHLDNYTTDVSRNNLGVVYRVLFVPPPDPNSIASYLEYREPYWKYFAMWDAILALGMGMFATVAMWHLPRRRFPMLQSYAVVIGLFVLAIWWASYNIDAIFLWSIERVTAYVVLSIAMLTLGQQIGRPVARFAVKTIIPPKLRQHVNFLWLCDGKTPPTLPVKP